MKYIYFTPGPSQLYPTVPQHIKNALKENIGSISHRGKKFEEIYSACSMALRKLLNIPKDYHVFFVSSGTESMERAIQNCVSKYSFHFVNGSFSKRFFQIAQELGKNAKMIESPFGEGFDFKNIKIPKETELICFTQNETSSGVMTPVEEINKIAKANPDKLIAVDIVSSVPYVGLEFNLLDVVFFSVQKGFGLPAGLGIMIVSPRALKKTEDLAKSGENIGSYHNFLWLSKFEQKNQTPDTPPVLEMYLLWKVVEDMLGIGLVKIREDTEAKSKLIYDFLDNHKSFEALVKDSKVRSKTVIVVHIGEKQAEVKKYLEQKGFIVGSGYGEHKDKQIRIANLPAHSIEDVERLIAYL